MAGPAVVEHGRGRIETVNAAASRVVPARGFEFRFVTELERKVQLVCDLLVERSSIPAVEKQVRAQCERNIRLIGSQDARNLEVREG